MSRRDVYLSLQYLGHESDRVEPVLDLLDLGVLGDATGRCDRRRQIERRDSRHLERQFALTADLGDWHWKNRRKMSQSVTEPIIVQTEGKKGIGRTSLAAPLYLLALAVAALAGDLDREGRALDVVVGELEVHDVVAGLGRLVGDVEGAVLVVLALYLGLARALHGEREPAVAGVAGVDGEGVVRVGLALLEGRPGHLDLLRVADLAVLDVDLEGRVGDVLAHALDRDLVGPGLAGRERHADVAARHLLQEAGLLEAARGRYVRVQRADVGVADLARQLDLGGRAHRDLVALAALAWGFGGILAIGLVARGRDSDPALVVLCIYNEIL